MSVSVTDIGKMPVLSHSVSKMVTFSEPFVGSSAIELGSSELSCIFKLNNSLLGHNEGVSWIIGSDTNAFSSDIKYVRSLTCVVGKIDLTQLT